MLCPKCNIEIPEGMLYCPECGEEIIIVSDFDINLQDNIDTTVISDTTEIPDINGNTKEIVNVKDNEPITTESSTKDIKKLPIILGIVVFILLSIGLYFGIRGIKNYTSYEYQYDKAKTEFESGEYKSALKTVKHALSMDEKDVKGYVLLADIYFEQNNYDAAIAALIEALNDNPGMIALYERIVKCYETEGDYESARSILELSDDSIKERFSWYFPKEPQFSLESGTYIKPSPIILVSDGEGQIFYTTDGSIPSKESLPYSEGIPLEEGENVISAIFINDKGIASEVSTNTYIVENDIPDIPVMLTKSGSYNVPNPIGVVMVPGVNYYYTAGSSIPNEDDNRYEMPLFMPFGKSQYSFVAQSESGEYSQSITVDYDFSFAAPINKQVAEYAISYHLLTIGDAGVGNTYVSNSGYMHESVPYYIVDEMNGTSKTGRTFAVDANSGALFKVSVDNESKIYKFNPM